MCVRAITNDTCSSCLISKSSRRGKTGQSGLGGLPLLSGIVRESITALVMFLCETPVTWRMFFERYRINSSSTSHKVHPRIDRRARYSRLVEQSDCDGCLGQGDDSWAELMKAPVHGVEIMGPDEIRNGGFIVRMRIDFDGMVDFARRFKVRRFHLLEQQCNRAPIGYRYCAAFLGSESKQ